MDQITVNGLRKTFKNNGGGIYVNKLTFERGKATLIIGTSGAGKSTFIRCLLNNTTYEPKNAFEGLRVQDIAYIPQKHALNERETVFNCVFWNLSLHEHRRLSFSLSKRGTEAARRADEVLRQLGLQAKRDLTISRLSGGQKQRVSIAKELVCNLPVIVADEIDTGLDLGVSRSLIQDLCRITRDEENPKTTIIISHNLTNIELFDQVVIFAKGSDKVGKVAYAGPPSQLLSYFGAKDYIEVLMMLNPEDEGGYDQADLFIELWESRT